jgi:integrase
MQGNLEQLSHRVSRDRDGSVGLLNQQRPSKAACKAVKIGDMTFHELRHTYASRLVMNGAPQPV